MMMLCIGCVVVLLHGECQLAAGGLDLVLGLQVVHAVGGDAVDGQDQVSHSHASLGCLASVVELGEHVITYTPG